jgi:hypothetical protein
MLGEPNISSSFAVLLSLEFKVVKAIQKTPTILKHAIRFFSYLSKRYAIDCRQDIASGQIYYRDLLNIDTWL